MVVWCVVDVVFLYRVQILTLVDFSRLWNRDISVSSRLILFLPWPNSQCSMHPSMVWLMAPRYWPLRLIICFTRLLATWLLSQLVHLVNVKGSMLQMGGSLMSVSLNKKYMLSSFCSSWLLATRLLLFNLPAKFELDKVELGASLNKKCVISKFILFPLIVGYLTFIFDPAPEIRTW
jgi:hypothetical protein